jgi:hypothetical protein
MQVMFIRQDARNKHNTFSQGRFADEIRLRAISIEQIQPYICELILTTEDKVKSR